MSQLISRPAPARGQTLKLVLAAAAASFAAAAFWASQNLLLEQSDRWQDGAIVAAALALWLTWAASRRAGPEQAADAYRRAARAETRRGATVKARPDAGAAAKAAAPEASPFDAERKRLLASGLTEHEVSQVLIARASGAGKSSPLGSGVAGGVLNNLDAVATHLRSLMPSIKSDLTRIMDRDADSAARLSGAVSLGVKAVAAVVIGYFVYLEALQFRSAAYKAWADACIERQKNAINFSPMNELLTGNAALRALDKECRSQ